MDMDTQPQGQQAAVPVFQPQVGSTQKLLRREGAEQMFVQTGDWGRAFVYWLLVPDFLWR